METFLEPPTLRDTQLYCTNTVKHMSHVRLSLLLFCSMVAPRSAPSHPCQRSFLLGCPVPIRQGACPFKAPREHETEPGPRCQLVVPSASQWDGKAFVLGGNLRSSRRAARLCMHTCASCFGNGDSESQFWGQLATNNVADIVLYVWLVCTYRNFGQNYQHFKFGFLLSDQGKIAIVFITTFLEWLSNYKGNV